MLRRICFRIVRIRFVRCVVCAIGLFRLDGLEFLIVKIIAHCNEYFYFAMAETYWQNLVFSTYRLSTMKKAGLSPERRILRL